MNFNKVATVCHVIILYSNCVTNECMSVSFSDNHEVCMRCVVKIHKVAIGHQCMFFVPIRILL